MLDKFTAFSRPKIEPNTRSKIEYALQDDHLVISPQGRISVRNKLFEEIGRDRIYMVVYYNKTDHILGLRFFKSKVRDSFKLCVQNTRGSVTGGASARTAFDQFRLNTRKISGKYKRAGGYRAGVGSVLCRQMNDGSYFWEVTLNG